MSSENTGQAITTYLVHRCAVRPSSITATASLTDNLGLDDESSVEFAEWFADRFQHPLPPIVVSAMADSPPPVSSWLIVDLLRPSSKFRHSRACYVVLRKSITVTALARFAEDADVTIFKPQTNVAASSPIVRSGMQLGILWIFFLIIAQFQTAWSSLEGSAALALILTTIVWIVAQPIGAWTMRRWQIRFRQAAQKSWVLSG